MISNDILDNGWIGIYYRLPANPSRIRVQVWRKLKKNGALIYQQGVAVLPGSEQFTAFLQEMKGEIAALGGKAVLAQMNFLDADDAQLLIERFNNSLASEYGDIKNKLSGIRDELENRWREDILDATCLNENLALIRKLRKAYETVKLRDHYRLPLQERIEERIEDLVRTIQHYHDALNGKTYPFG